MKLPKNYTFEELVERAVKNAVPHTADKAERWIAVRDTFATGSTIAQELCRCYGLDPFEIPGVYESIAWRRGDF